ncbi:MAG: hypothetical protein HY904_05080 [Deltaproteobacteria bacterium]|nr:hypothetical protein [Deltaproteobacteria bacterium]
MGWLTALWCVAAQAPPAASPDVVLVLPIESRTPALADEADLLTTALADALRKQSGWKVVTLRDVEGALNLEMKKQLAGCGTASCAAEIAGALNTDQVVLGTLGTVGENNMLLSLSRMKAGTAAILGSATLRIRSHDPGEVLDAMPGAVAELLGHAGAVPPPTSTTPANVLGAVVTPARPDPAPRPRRIHADHVEVDRFMTPLLGPQREELTWPGFYTRVGHPELAAAYSARTAFRWGLRVAAVLLILAGIPAIPAASLVATGLMLGVGVSPVWLPQQGGLALVGGVVVAGVLAMVGLILGGALALVGAILGGVGLFLWAALMDPQPASDEEIRSIAEAHNRKLDESP